MDQNTDTKADSNKDFKFNILIITFLSIFTIYLGTWTGYYFFIHENFYSSGTIIQALSKTWDGGWYSNIAQNGYFYNGNPHIQQNIAFFPLYPLIIKLLSLIFGFHSGLANVIPAFFFGLISIFLFYEFAKSKMDNVSALFATFLYALYPGAAFFISGYPTSLMNLLSILALLAFSKRKYYTAAVFAGLSTAAGPLTIFLSIALFIFYSKSMIYGKNRLIFLDILKILLFGIISISGILCFMLYQKIYFGTPFAFIDVQQAWCFATVTERLLHIIELYVVFGGGYSGFLRSIFFMRQDYINAIAMGLYYIFNLFFIILSLLATFILLKYKKWLLFTYSLLVVVGYIWFMASIQGPINAYRLLYIDIPMFIAFGLYYQRNKNSLFTNFLLILFGTALFFQSALFISQYAVW